MGVGVPQLGAKKLRCASVQPSMDTTLQLGVRRGTNSFCKVEVAEVGMDDNGGISHRCAIASVIQKWTSQQTWPFLLG